MFLYFNQKILMKGFVWIISKLIFENNQVKHWDFNCVFTGAETNPKFRFQIFLSNQTILRGKNELTRQDFNSLKNSEFIIGSNEQITEQDFILFLVVPHEIL